MKSLIAAFLLIISVGPFKANAQKYNWAFNVGEVDRSESNTLVVDHACNVVAVGSFRGNADFDPIKGVTNLLSAGGTDFFFAKYNNL